MIEDDVTSGLLPRNSRYAWVTRTDSHTVGWHGWIYGGTIAEVGKKVKKEIASMMGARFELAQGYPYQDMIMCPLFEDLP